jgi:hypothetical protein
VQNLLLNLPLVVAIKSLLIEKYKGIEQAIVDTVTMINFSIGKEE